MGHSGVEPPAAAPKPRLVFRFAEANRRLCGFFERAMPHFFATQGEGSTYVPRLVATATTVSEQPGAEILEVGGIDRPLIRRGDSFRYVGLDVEYRDRCEEVYDDFLVQSVEAPIAGQFDLILSQHLLEHVPDNRASMRAILGALKPGGLTEHYVPSKNHPYAIVLRIIGNRLQRLLLERLSPGGETKGGYATYFDHCTAAQMSRLLEETGFEGVERTAYYSPTPYFRVLFPLHAAIVIFMHVCRIFRLESLASGFMVSGRKPASGGI